MSERSLRAEQSIIGAALLAPSILSGIDISAGEFTDENLREIYSAIQTLISEDQVIDVFTVTDYLDKRTGKNWLPVVGELSGKTPSAEVKNAQAYANVVREESRIRVAMEAGADLINTLQNSRDLSAVDAAIKTLMAIDGAGKNYDHSAADMCRSAADELEKAFNAHMSGRPMGISTGLKELDETLGGFHNSDLVVIPARPAMGKAQPLDSGVLLASGEWIRMGDVKIGDKLASVDGKPSEVTGVFPQGSRPIYKLTLSDGRVVEADEEHLWSIESSRFEGERTLTTLELVEMLGKVRYKDRVRLVSHSGDFGSDQDIGIDPWLLGFLIGDGCFKKSSTTFSTNEEYIIRRVNDALPDVCSVKYKEKYDYNIVCSESSNSITNWIREHGLGQKNSHEKFIPQVVFLSKRDVRESVLAGLIESDGWIQDGSLQFSTASEQLAKQVVNLTRSIGGVASYRCKEKPKYQHNGETRIGKPAYICSMAIENLADFIRSPRISKNIVKRRKSCQPIVRSVEFSRCDQAQCVMVSHPRHLYITDGYTVTHNTALMLNMALGGQAKCGIISSEQGHEQVGLRCISISGSVSSHKMRNGDLGDAEWSKIMAAVGNLKDRTIWVNDKATITIQEIQRKAREWKFKYGIEVLFVDYIQRIKTTTQHMNKIGQVEEVTTGLKNLAKELDIPVIALAQVNRECEKHENKRPNMGHVADASIIEKEADSMIVLYRDEVYNENSPDKGVAELGILKNRHGPTGCIRVAWRGEYLQFKNLVEAI